MLAANAGSAALTAREAAALRLAGALRRSLVCVAAFTSEQYLPNRQQSKGSSLTSSGSTDDDEGEEVDPSPTAAAEAAGGAEAAAAAAPGAGGWQPQRARARRRPPQRVLVGFARTVGDNAVVATVHDVAVLPELRGRGLGRQLLHRITLQVRCREW